MESCKGTRPAHAGMSQSVGLHIRQVLLLLFTHPSKRFYGVLIASLHAGRQSLSGQQEGVVRPWTMESYQNTLIFQTIAEWWKIHVLPKSSINLNFNDLCQEEIDTKSFQISFMILQKHLLPKTSSLEQLCTDVRKTSCLSVSQACHSNYDLVNEGEV